MEWQELPRPRWLSCGPPVFPCIKMFVTEDLSLALPFSDFAIVFQETSPYCWLVRLVTVSALCMTCALTCKHCNMLLDPLFTMLNEVARPLCREAGTQYFSPVSVSENFYLPCKALEKLQDSAVV